METVEYHSLMNSYMLVTITSCSVVNKKQFSLLCSTKVTDVAPLGTFIDSRCIFARVVWILIK